jgi:hypothetical protein
MRRFGAMLPLTCMLAVYVVFAMAGCVRSEEGASESTIRIGTFDSRALAAAYGRSDVFKSQVAELTAEYEKAKASGDERRIKELEVEGPALQKVLENQVFSTWPVDNILKQIEDKIPEIAEQADVGVIVCKWDVVYQESGVEFVDVTDLLVNLFEPDEETLRTIDNLKATNPIPLKELEEH